MRARHSWVSGGVGGGDLPNTPPANSTKTTNYVSVDNLQMLQTARLVCSGQRLPETAKNQSSKSTTTSPALTQSCSNLKSVIPAAQPSSSINSPGALRVRTHFISPPLRVVKSFHGKTSFGNKIMHQSDLGLENKVVDGSAGDKAENT